MNCQTCQLTTDDGDGGSFSYSVAKRKTTLRDPATAPAAGRTAGTCSRACRPAACARPAARCRARPRGRRPPRARTAAAARHRHLQIHRRRRSSRSGSMVGSKIAPFGRVTTKDYTPKMKAYPSHSSLESPHTNTMMSLVTYATR